mmetsp:Transcript_25142/g.65276  ORF Transcript_25142/g.65276 Transcript_25142/m.65276 type:complete len:259 (+) Transcript_25142:475-1251(+)
MPLRYQRSQRGLQAVPGDCDICHSLLSNVAGRHRLHLVRARASVGLVCTELGGAVPQRARLAQRFEDLRVHLLQRPLARRSERKDSLAELPHSWRSLVHLEVGDAGARQRDRGRQPRDPAADYCHSRHLLFTHLRRSTAQVRPIRCSQAAAVLVHRSPGREEEGGAQDRQLYYGVGTAEVVPGAAEPETLVMYAKVPAIDKGGCTAGTFWTRRSRRKRCRPQKRTSVDTKLCGRLARSDKVGAAILACCWYTRQCAPG